MARLGRVVVPGIPHHVTQRGNRKQQTFFSEFDYQAYLEMAARACRRFGVTVWAYCLMPNHIHFIAIPASRNALKNAFGDIHRRYSCRVNIREDWRGSLWQGRFGSCPMDESHLLACARYIELNPVEAGLCKRPEEYPWSSAYAHLTGQDDELLATHPLLDLVTDWEAFLNGGSDKQMIGNLRLHARTGRPLGDNRFVDSLEEQLNRILRPQKPGPKPK